MKKIKKYLLFWLLFLVILPCFVRAEEMEEPGTLYARSAVLMDADSGRILYEKNGHQAMANASTTKILTCIIALLLFHKKKHPIPFEYFVKPLIKILFAVAVSTVMSNLWLRAGLMQIAIINFIMAAIIEFGCYILISIICREEVVMDCIGLVKNRLGGKHE